MGLMEEIIGGYFRAALEPAFAEIRMQHVEDMAYVQKVAIAQALMEHEYELQCYREKEEEELEENIRCWFKRNM